MSNTNTSNARSTRASRKRARAPGNAPAPGTQGSAKRRRTGRNRKRNAKRGRAAAAQAGDPSAQSSIVGFFAPVAEGTVMKSLKPVFERTAHDWQRIVHREKITKVTTPGTGAFTVLATVPLQPGLAGSFPWLSNEAAGWESYRINRMRFTLVPAVGTASSGDVIMAPDYDAADPAPIGETAMSSYTDAQESNVWARFCCEMDPDLLNGEARRKFLRVGALAPNQDIKTYDSGNLFVASTDDAAANTSKLWVDYDVTLFNPHVPPGGFQASGTLTGNGTAAAATPFGTAPVALGPIILTGASTNVLAMSNVQVGQEVCVSASVNGTVISAIAFNTLVGLTLKDTLFAGFVAAATSANATSTYIVTAQNPSLVLAITATTVNQTLVVATVLAPIASF